MRQERVREFRTMTVNMGGRKIRTLIVMMSVVLAALFIFLGVVAVQLIAPTSDQSLASKMLQSLSNRSLSGIIEQEIPLYASTNTQALGQPPQQSHHVLDMLFYVFTDIDPSNPMTVMGGNITAMAVSNFKPLTKGYDPPGPDVLPQTPDQQIFPPQTSDPEPIQSNGKPLVYIYHTHNRESFLPELPNIKEPNQAYDRNTNITLVGDRLSKSLVAKKIDVIHTKNDYWYKGDVQNEYDLSRKTVQEVLKKNDSIKMVFDIHRDSEPRERTTAKWHDQDVAKVFFIIGGTNPNKEKNTEFALRLHNKLEQMYPGVSKGVHENVHKIDDSRYNQDLSPNSVLIEIGGPENSLQEDYRTADLLANVIAELASNTQSTDKSN